MQINWPYSYCPAFKDFSRTLYYTSINIASSQRRCFVCSRPISFSSAFFAQSFLTDYSTEKRVEAPIIKEIGYGYPNKKKRDFALPTLVAPLRAFVAAITLFRTCST